MENHIGIILAASVESTDALMSADSPRRYGQFPLRWLQYDKRLNCMVIGVSCGLQILIESHRFQAILLARIPN